MRHRIGVGVWCLVLVLGWALPAVAEEPAFVPASREECQQVREIAEQTFKKPFALTPDASFVSYHETADGRGREETRRGCRLSAKGTGVDFPELPGAEDKKLQDALKGWTPITDNSFYGGYGTSGGRSALRRGDSVLVIEVGWEPTREAQALAARKCPNEPIDGCVKYIKAKQKRYTFNVFITSKGH